MAENLPQSSRQSALHRLEPRRVARFAVVAQILFLHPSDDGYGIDRVALETVHALRAAGHDMHCVIEAANPGNGWLSERLSQAGIEWEKAPLGFLSRAQVRSLPAAARWLAQQTAVARHIAARIRAADLVYVNGFTLIGVATAARLRRRQVLLHLHEIPPANRAVGRAIRAASTS